MTTPDPQTNPPQPTFWEKAKFIAVEKALLLKERWNNYSEGKTRWGLALRLIGGFVGVMALFVLTFTLMVRFGAFGKLPTKQDLVNIRNDNATEI